MSIFEIAHRPGRTAALAAVVRALAGTMVRNGLAALAANRAARGSAGRLEHLSDRELKDIGLTRSDLGRIAREGRLAD
jgi:uncharacterized protein YjiS (DUF1127 family)